MARGKHRKSAAGRRSAAEQTQVAALRAELEAEQHALDELIAQDAEFAALLAGLADDVAARDRDAKPMLDLLEQESALLTRILREEAAALDEVQRLWDKVSDRIIEHYGGGRDGFEKFGRLLGMTGFLSDENFTDGARTLRLQYLRRERREMKDVREATSASTLDAFGPLLRHQDLQPLRDAGLDPADTLADIQPTPEQAAALDEVAAVAEQVIASKATSLDPRAIHAWHPLIWVGTDPGSPTPDGTLNDLGALPHVVDQPATSQPPAPVTPAWPAPTSALSAATRARLANSGTPDDLCRHWRTQLDAGEALCAALGSLHGPFSSGPLHPLPGRAATLKHWYTKAALGSWSRALDRTHQPSAESDPAALSVDVRLAETAIGCATAASFWLPTGQAAAFADSDALDDEDRAALLLPFPQVFLAFAEPLLVPPRRQRTAPEEWAHREMVRTIASRSPGLMAVWGALVPPRPDDDPMELPALADMLDHDGAAIEGVLLLADSMGRVSDTMAWCVRLGVDAPASLGRHLIPASLSATIHRHLVENLIAVAAWADWHDPDDELATAGLDGPTIRELAKKPTFRRDADRAGAGGVRVLNTRATHGGGAGEDDGTPKRELAPHVRRGHWRRQRFGPGRQQIKRIRIAPVVVNAAKGNIGHRVYTVAHRGS